jgi:hypothetical protein
MRMNVDFSVTGFSLSAWLDDHDINAGQQLQSYIVDLLLEELDVAGYLINPPKKVAKPAFMVILK